MTLIFCLNSMSFSFVCFLDGFRRVSFVFDRTLPFFTYLSEYFLELWLPKGANIHSQNGLHVFCIGKKRYLPPPHPSRPSSSGRHDLDQLSSTLLSRVCIILLRQIRRRRFLSWEFKWDLRVVEFLFKGHVVIKSF